MIIRLRCEPQSKIAGRGTLASMLYVSELNSHIDFAGWFLPGCVTSKLRASIAKLTFTHFL
jgi:hypothetical protein